MQSPITIATVERDKKRKKTKKEWKLRIKKIWAHRAATIKKNPYYWAYMIRNETKVVYSPQHLNDLHVSLEELIQMHNSWIYMCHWFDAIFCLCRLFVEVRATDRPPGLPDPPLARSSAVDVSFNRFIWYIINTCTDCTHCLMYFFAIFCCCCCCSAPPSLFFSLPLDHHSCKVLNEFPRIRCTRQTWPEYYCARCTQTAMEGKNMRKSTAFFSISVNDIGNVRHAICCFSWLFTFWPCFVYIHLSLTIVIHLFCFLSFFIFYFYFQFVHKYSSVLKIYISIYCVWTPGFKLLSLRWKCLFFF